MGAAQMNEPKDQLNAATPRSEDMGEKQFWGLVVDQAVSEQTGHDGEPEALAASAVDEIEKLMGELVSARDYLKAESERIKRENARLKNLSTTALASVHIISDNLSKWRENGKAA
jgi:hypothetical protein